MNCPPDNNRDTAAGFTLLELMIAMAVLAIALVALLSSQSRTVLVADNNDFTATSARLGARQLAELLSKEVDASPRGDSFDAPHEAYFWEMTRGPVPLEQDLLPVEVASHLQRIEMVIGDERRDRSITITRYRFMPEQP